MTKTYLVHRQGIDLVLEPVFDGSGLEWEDAREALEKHYNYLANYAAEQERKWIGMAEKRVQG